MKRRIPILPLALALALALLSLPLHAETWEKLPLIDGHCVEKVKDAPDAHPRTCAIQCARGGYGVLTADGTYLRFDEEGNRKALEALKKSDRKDKLRATVEGTLDGGIIKVETLTLH